MPELREHLDLVDFRLRIPYTEFVCTTCLQLVRVPVQGFTVTISTGLDTVCPDCWAQRLRAIADENEARWAKETL